jgi:hypothetical protein
LEEQGYPLVENVFYQDNESAIRFERNGRKSCGPNSRHIDIRYFFIKDRLEIENMTVKHCPTEQMLADFFTKPLQGSPSLSEVQGRGHGTQTYRFIEDADAKTPSQERVGKDNLIKIVGNGPDR